MVSLSCRLSGGSKCAAPTRRADRPASHTAQSVGSTPTAGGHHVIIIQLQTLTVEMTGPAQL